MRNAARQASKEVKKDVKKKISEAAAEAHKLARKGYPPKCVTRGAARGVIRMLRGRIVYPGMRVKA